MSGYALTPRARADLKAIWTYTADHWSIEQADRYAGLLHHAMEIVAAEPRRWRPCDDIRDSYFKYAAGSHVLFFRRGESGIVVVRILHRSMDFERHL
ncbi:MAG: type II toxin-antitoxin system RelE/ParE family toxin [Pseudolabrys sp.]|nr:type II toxin-antitoxin system RelE/ParE family toxin [Pseudolabrys sp.]